MAQTNEKDKDAVILVRVQNRILRAKKRHGTLRRVAAGVGVNHYYLSYVLQGNVPTSEKVRKALGFPRLMPSERKARAGRKVPPLGSIGWEDVYLKKLKGRKA
jgi:hypothetical protein